MIRELNETDIGQVADIWLDTNIKAHEFIPAQYWQNINFQYAEQINRKFIEK